MGLRSAFLEDVFERLIQEGKKNEALRQLIGPRGGLPTLKQDLLRLASLLHIKLDEKATVAEIKELCRPLVKDIAMSSVEEPKESSSSAATSSVEKVPAKAIMPPAPQRVTNQVEIQSPAPGITVQEVHQLIQEQDQRFQAMMGQVMSHVMNMQSATQVSPPDQEMSSDGWSEFSAEDIQRLNAEARGELRMERYEAQHGPWIDPQDLM